MAVGDLMRGARAGLVQTLRCLFTVVSRRADRLSRSPATTLVLGVFLLADACTLPVESTVGIFLCGQRRDSALTPVAALVQFRNGRGLVEKSRALNDPRFEWPVVELLTCDPRGRGDGWWAITSRVWDPQVRAVGPLRSGYPVVSRDTRHLFAQAMSRSDFLEHPEYLDAMRAGTGPFVEVQWLGFAHNLLSLATALSFVLSFRWVPRWLASLGPIDRVDPMRCAICGYDLRGNPGRGCPECGWNRDDALRPPVTS